MKKQLEDGIKLVSELIANTSPDSEIHRRLLSLMGTLQGLLILESIK